MAPAPTRDQKQQATVRRRRKQDQTEQCRPRQASTEARLPRLEPVPFVQERVGGHSKRRGIQRPDRLTAELLADIARGPRRSRGRYMFPRQGHEEVRS